MSQIPFRLDDALVALARTPAVLDALLRMLPAPWVDATDGTDTWSPRQVVAHLLDGEQVDWVPRAKAMLAAEPGAPPTFEPYDIEGSVASAGERPLAEWLDAFAEARAANVAWLRDAAPSEADLARTAVHPALGAITLRQMLATWVAHDHGHIVQIARTLARQSRDDVGPWTAFLSVFEATP